MDVSRGVCSLFDNIIHNRRTVSPGITECASAHLLEPLGEAERAERLRLARLNGAHIAAHYRVGSSTERVLSRNNIQVECLGRTFHHTTGNTLYN